MNEATRKQWSQETTDLTGISRRILLGRSGRTALSFVIYLIAHPEERFWQALRNWSGYNFVAASNDPVHDIMIHDTFYWEGRSK